MCVWGHSFKMAADSNQRFSDVKQMPAKQLRDLKPDFPDTDWYGDANIKDTYNGNHQNFVDSDSGLHLQLRKSTGKFLLVTCIDIRS